VPSVSAVPAAPLGGLGALGGANALQLTAAAQVNRKQRELYVGNLPVGVVTAGSLKELFMQPLSTMPGADSAAGQAVLNVDLAPDGKFGFVEFRDEQICSVALTLFDKMELCGRPLNVGRPRGYIEPGTAPTLNLPISLPGIPAAPPPKPPAPSAPVPTRTIKLNGMITPDMLKDDEEYKDVLEDIRLECERFGAGVEVRIPREGEQHEGACFLRYKDLAGSVKARDALHNRQFDGNSVTAVFIPESDF